MEIKRIQEVVDHWRSATDKVIEFENPGYKEVRELFKTTYEIIEKYRKEKLVPKVLSGLLLEMHDFSWWVSDLEETPLHCHYQKIVSLTNQLSKYFLTSNADTQNIKNIIEEITE